MPLISNKGSGALLTRAIAWIRMIRVGNALALGLAALIGAMFGRASEPGLLLLVFIVPFFVGSGGNVINDYFDRHVDAISKPWRPIPAGLVRPGEALVGAIILFGLGISLATLTSLVNGLIAAMASLLVSLYSYRLKRMLVAGNVTIAFLVALAFVYGGLTSELTPNALLAAGYAFMLNLGREFLKGIEDVEGDKVWGINTIATVYGPRAAYMAALSVYLVTIALSPLPLALFGYGFYYAVLAALVDLFLTLSLYIARSLRPETALRATRLLKAAVFLGLLAFLSEALRRLIPPS